MQDFFGWNYWGLSFLGLFIIMWAVQLYYFLYYFLRIGGAKMTEFKKHHRPVSIIIAARNEEKNLMEHIPLIMDQDHPEFEVIVVNDSSWDDTEAILKALHIQFPNMHIINLDEEKQNMQGKKFALTLGIKAAKYDTILLTDADCMPLDNTWITRMTADLEEPKQLVIGFSPYKRYPGWLNKIIRFDTMIIGLQYLSQAKLGTPYMGVGRNLAYNRALFFSVGGFKSHYSIASGDDDLFVNQVGNKRNTAVQFVPESQTTSEPKKNWKDWFIQKRRHFSTAPYYKSSDKNFLGLWPFSFLFMFVGFAGSMVLKNGMFVVGGMLLVRYIVQLATLHGSAKRLGLSKDIVWLSPFLEIHLHFLNAGLYLTNLLRKQQKWN
jgi:cellulose synthase/poly-beta-1,6-N-acetylglucosamine synthase-like glycosyltransferase